MAKVFFSLILLFVAAVSGIAQDEIFIRDGTFDPEFEKVLMSDKMLLQEGGARVLEYHGIRYFVAVGVTSIEGVTPMERIRQLRVGRSQALKAAAEFIKGTEVKAETKLNETSIISISDNRKTGVTTKTLDESVVSKIESVIHVPQLVGTWISKDGKLFFYALGKKLS